jgi:uncharacterized YigZ family protein
MGLTMLEDGVGEHYQTIERPSVAEFKDRGSRFIAFVFPVATLQEAKGHLHKVKKEHPKAEHHCFAYRLGADRAVYRASDDGEPSGSAGRPILGQIDSKELTNTLVVVVRYFGGTLLGVPGLIHAYKSATSLALQLVPIVRKPVEVLYELHFDYTLLNSVMQVVRGQQCNIVEQDLQLFCRMIIGVPKYRIPSLLHQMEDLYGVELKPYAGPR